MQPEPPTVFLKRHAKRSMLLLWSALAGVLMLAIVVAAATMLPLRHGNQAKAHQVDWWSDDETETATSDQPVKTVRPKANRQFARSVQEPAYVEGFYKADLYARVPGTVRYVRGDIGTAVATGDILIELDVPDLVQDIAQKAALVKQALADVEMAEADVRTKEELVETARSIVLEKEAGVKREAAEADARQRLLTRIREGVAKNVYTPQLADEKLREYEAAKAACDSAAASVLRAKSDVKVAQAKIAEASADLGVKTARVAVAEEARKQAQTMADLAKIRAPFNGVVVARNVDPGAFVQNAATAHTKPMLALERIDKVTVAMMVPERSAPFVTTDTEAVIQLDSFPSEQIHAKITRFSPSLDPQRGRTMRVEVDLYNPPERNYPRASARGVAAFLAPLAGATPLNTAAALASGRNTWGRRGLLVPGMYGKMRLLLQKHSNAFLVPISSVFSEGGQTFIYQIIEGHARKVPVHVELEDGTQAEIVIVERSTDPDGNEIEELHHLTGKEEIVLNGQAEIAEDQAVKTSLMDWKPGHAIAP